MQLYYWQVLSCSQVPRIRKMILAQVHQIVFAVFASLTANAIMINRVVAAVAIVKQRANRTNQIAIVRPVANREVTDALVRQTASNATPELVRITARSKL